MDAQSPLNLAVFVIVLLILIVLAIKLLDHV